MKKSYTWANGELNAKILLKSPEKQIILTAMHQGTEISSFQSNDSVTLQIIEGKLRFHHRKDTITLYKGQLMTLNDNIKYRLTTEEETVFLLTISNTSTKYTTN
jgi:quercetin dioxygenase-like cupin family protein